jgi:hypothetical protein
MFVNQFRHALLQAAMAALTQELKILIQLDESISLLISGTFDCITQCTIA